VTDESESNQDEGRPQLLGRVYFSGQASTYPGWYLETRDTDGNLVTKRLWIYDEDATTDAVVREAAEVIGCRPEQIFVETRPR
jgi:hypothetical protein